MRRLLLLIPLLGACDAPLRVETGEHVVYRWSPDEGRLCGGTVPMIDRFIAAHADAYGWPKSEIGFDLFWDAELAQTACAGLDLAGCTKLSWSRTMVFMARPFSAHEFAHTSMIAARRTESGYPRFIEEGLAERWNSTVLSGSPTWTTASTSLDTSELRVALNRDHSADVNYHDAYTWFLALEVEFGRTKMAELFVELEGASTADDVDAALQRALGITLAESAALAAELPPGQPDDPACELDGLPTYTWTGAPLEIDPDLRTCADEELVNVGGETVAWLFVLEFPDPPTTTFQIQLTPYAATTPMHVDLKHCDGQFTVDDIHVLHSTNFGESEPQPPRDVGPMRGRWVGAIHGELLDDGSIGFPRIVYTETPP